MEKMELSEALKANASILEGLLPLAGAETKGLMSVDQYKSTYTSIEIKTPGLIKICEVGSSAYICSIRTYGVGALISISSADQAEYIRVSEIGTTVLNNNHYNIYRDSNGGIYVYSASPIGFTVSILRASDPRKIIMKKSDIDLESLIKLL